MTARDTLDQLANLGIRFRGATDAEDPCPICKKPLKKAHDHGVRVNPRPSGPPPPSPPGPPAALAASPPALDAATVEQVADALHVIGTCWTAPPGATNREVELEMADALLSALRAATPASGEPDPDRLAQLLIGEAKVIDQALVEAEGGKADIEQLEAARKTLAALPAKFRASAPGGIEAVVPGAVDE